MKIQEQRIKNLQKENEALKNQKGLEEDNKDDMRAYKKLLKEITNESVNDTEFKKAANKINKNTIIEDLFRTKREAVNYKFEY